jgi:WD40 repeat protein
MTEARFGSTATLLPNGKVLIVGGSDSGFHATAELYDPKTGTFSPTGSMYYQVARGFATATLLANGLVLVAGGSVNGLAELYDPATGTFSPTDPMGANRADATATMLRDGRVLMAGGIDRCDGPSCSPFYTAELYDPKTGTFSPTGSMKAARYNATATLLLDGRVLVAGGNVGDTDKPKPVADAEVYDPATGKFTPTGSMAVARSDAGAVLLHDGQVLIAGGDGESTSAELYDPATGTFRTTGEMFHSHGDANATMLLDGRVLVDGGATVAEVYDPSSGEFTQIDSEVILRIGTTATPLQDGRVLIAGGWDGKTRYSSAELYVP